MGDNTELRKGFELGRWRVLPTRGLLRDADTELHVEPLPMDVLVVLAEGQGEVVSKDELVEKVWQGRPVADEVITRCISVLRRSLGDDARAPTFIENVPRRGYRLKVPVMLPQAPEAETPAVRATRAAYVLPLAAGFVALALIAGFVFLRPATHVTGGPIRSVVVFPFECNIDKQYLCFGFSEALTSTLYRLDELRVVKSREGFAEGMSTRDAARDFGVDAVIEGVVRYDGTRFTVVADLVDGRNESVLFSNAYVGAEDNVFEFQERVATDVRRSITGKGSAKLVSASRPASFAAFDKYSEGQYEFEKRGIGSIRRAIGLFQQTLELDPHFGPAYLMLAYAYALLPEYSDEPQDLMYEKALAVVRQGSQADPGISDAIATVDGFIAHKRGDWIAAERAYRRALSADTVYPLTHQLYSRLLASVGRLDASLEEARRARELDPQSAVLISRLAIANYWVGRIEEARRLFELANHMELESPIHDLAYALFEFGQGDVDAARQFAKDGLAKYGADSSWVDPLMDSFEDPARHAEAHRIVGELSATGKLPERIEITLWAILGDADNAMRIARRLEHEGEIFEAELLFIPQFRVVREHPDFASLMDSVGLLEYWKTVGCRWQDDAVTCSADPVI